MEDGVKPERQIVRAQTPKGWLAPWNKETTLAVEAEGIRETGPNQPSTLIRFNEIAKVRLSGRFVSRFEIIARDGRTISVRFAELEPELSAVLEAIAERIPPLAERESATTPRRLQGNWVKLVGVLSVISMICGAAFIALFSREPLGPIAGFLLLLGPAIYALSHPSLLVAIPLSPDSNGRIPLNRNGWAVINQGEFAMPEWKPGSMLRYIPSPWDRAAKPELYGAIFFALLIWFTVFVFSPFFGIFLVVMMSFVGWRIRNGFWVVSRFDDQFRIVPDYIELTRNGKTIRARLDTMKLRKRSPSLMLLQTYAVFTGPEGKIECDYRYLWPVDRPLYEPESPWEELWRTE